MGARRNRRRFPERVGGYGECGAAGSGIVLTARGAGCGGVGPDFNLAVGCDVPVIARHRFAGPPSWSIRAGGTGEDDLVRSRVEDARRGRPRSMGSAVSWEVGGECLTNPDTG
ncbi:hypothetical protein UO65_5455 [Actinokineospora spheciospongiae]|uniref:Uncharacterized protein n=1 Tax=Actinokineospora spheciospongiae TaxID=909613 RepID=W7IYX6_9PSEU|nr:hypothetical protein UO65_5455 [Actinokineospora spheciospongiae]